MPNMAIDHQLDNVIDIFTRKPLSELSNNKLIRIAPELDGLEMLYSNSENPEKLFSVKVLALGSAPQRRSCWSGALARPAGCL
jgi:hypothetical protein